MAEKALRTRMPTWTPLRLWNHVTSHRPGANVFQNGPHGDPLLSHPAAGSGSRTFLLTDTTFPLRWEKTSAGRLVCTRCPVITACAMSAENNEAIHVLRVKTIQVTVSP